MKIYKITEASKYLGNWAMSKPTEHGEHIAGQIQGEDAYGCSGTLTLADVWHIIDRHWPTYGAECKRLAKNMRTTIKYHAEHKEKRP